MSRSVTIVDYGCGNIFSVMRALEHCDAMPTLADNFAAIENADRLVLPGVGAFADGMHGLRERHLIEPIRHFAASGRPLLGICLGMQMLALGSEEFGKHEGLGLVAGQVVPVRDVDIEGRRHKIPHVGWANLLKPSSSRWDGTMLEGLPEGTPVYLVHSFQLVPDDSAHCLANCRYGGHSVVAAVQVANTIGCQFHPEKSGQAGLRILASFLRL